MHVSLLSDELLLEIFGQLDDVLTLLSVRQVCRRFQRVASDAGLFRTLTLPAGPSSRELLMDVVGAGRRGRMLDARRLVTVDVRSCPKVDLDTMGQVLPLLTGLRRLTVRSCVVEQTRGFVRLLQACPPSLEDLAVGTISGYVRDEDLAAVLACSSWPRLKRLRTLDLSVLNVQNLHDLIACISSPITTLNIRTTVAHSLFEMHEMLRNWLTTRQRRTKVGFWIYSAQFGCRMASTVRPTTAFTSSSLPRRRTLSSEDDGAQDGGHDNNDEDTAATSPMQLPTTTTTAAAAAAAAFLATRPQPPPNGKAMMQMLLGVSPYEMASPLTSLRLDNVCLTPLELQVLVGCNLAHLDELVLVPETPPEAPWDERVLHWVDRTLTRSPQLRTLRLANLPGLMDQLPLSSRPTSSALTAVDFGVNEGTVPRAWSYAGSSSSSSSAAAAAAQLPQLDLALLDEEGEGRADWTLTALRWLCLRCTRYALHTIIEHCGAQLTTLQVVLVDAWTDADMCKLVEACPRLQQLAILCNAASTVGEQGVAALGRLANLHVLRLHNFVGVRSGEGFVRLSQGTPLLEELSLSYMGASADGMLLTALPMALAQWRSLHTVRLLQPRLVVREAWHAALMALPKLSHLVLVGRAIDANMHATMELADRKAHLHYFRLGTVEYVKRIELRHDSHLWSSPNRHSATEVFALWSHMDYNLFDRLLT